ncbi:MAG: metal-sulfur cluster biosynthetic enzyme [Haloarculaceae archaeon]|jgi:metal-sulfur cluster biosynthetic enzyme
MSGEYDRPEREADATACGYTSYDGDADYETRDSVEGEVPATGAGAEGLERRVWAALYGVEDPEMPVSIVDLGLVYGVTVDGDAGRAAVEMTLTYTGCPARDMLLNDVEQAVAAVDGIEDAEVVLVWSPGWTVDMVTEQGKESLREFGLSV